MPAILAPTLLAMALALGGCAQNVRTYRTSASTTTTPAPTSSSTPPVPAPTSAASPSPPPSTAITTAPAASPPAGPAATLAALPVGSLNLSVPYQRTQDFGPAWSDVDHNGCDTRNDILHRDLTAIEVRPGTHGCVVVAGTLRDPYTGTTVVFDKAQASRVQIDHIVPLHAAWELGAYSWPYSERLAFANDPAELLAVDGHNNEVKSDSLADTWVPPNQGEWCDYARRTIAVHAAYHLAVTANEKAALGRLLGTCSGAVPAAPAPDPAPPVATQTTAPAPPPPSSSAGSSGGSGGDVYYKNCTAVRAAGKAPLHRGDPGYRPGLDRDDDGVACE